MAVLSSAALAYGSDSGAHRGKMNSDCMAKSAEQHSSKHQRGGAMQLPSAVIDKLNLSEQQKVALFDAQTASKAMRDSMRQVRQQGRQNMRNADSTNDFDPRQMFAQRGQWQTQMQKARSDIEQQWLAFWDALDSDQQAVIKDHMRAKQQRTSGKRG